MDLAVVAKFFAVYICLSNADSTPTTAGSTAAGTVSDGAIEMRLKHFLASS